MDMCNCFLHWCMNPTTMTKALIVSTAIIWILYDFWVYNKYGAAATISDVMRAWGYDSPWILVAFGALLWHFWGEVPNNR